MKPTLSFYTNIPSPYNLDLFEALSLHFNLTVIYYSEIEKGRQWLINTNHTNFNEIILKDNLIGRLVQKLIIEFHFSSKIIIQAYNDNSENIILSGNYFSANTYIVLFIANIRRKKIFWFGEKLFPTKNIFKKAIKYILLQPLFNSCKAIFCVGSEAIQIYMNYGYKGPCINTPYTINTFVFNKQNLNYKKLENIQNKFNPNKNFIILTSGSLIKRKGIDIAIESFLEISNSTSKKVSLWILGDGPEKTQLEQLSKCSKDIFFHGFIQSDDLPYYFNLADLFLFTSRYDGWAVVINEALASGLPIVVSNKVSASELIKDDVNGYICESGNVENFATSMLKIINNDDLRYQMSKRNYILSKSISSNKISKLIFNEIETNV